MKNALLFLLLNFLVSTTVYAQTNNNAIKVTDLKQIKQVNRVTISHDGRKIAYTLTAIVPDENRKSEYAYQTQLWLAATDGSFAPRALTSGSSSATLPAWSASDQTLAFVRSVENKPQIFLLPMNGGEPVQLTHAQHGATAPVWSPDGKQILYATSLNLAEMLKDSILNPGLKQPEWPLEKPGFSAETNASFSKEKLNPDGNIKEIRNYLLQDETDKKAKVFDKLNFQGEAATNPEFNFDHYYIIEAKAGAQPKALTRGFYSFSNAVFATDGKSILFTADINPKTHPDRSLQSQVYRLSLASRQMETLLSGNGINFTNSAVSPSGRYLVYQSAPGEGINIPQIGIYDFQNPAKKIAVPFDRNTSNFSWSADNQYLYFTAQSNGGIPIYRLNIKTFKTEQLGNFDSGISNLDVSKTGLAYVKTEVANPNELYVADLANKNAKRITTNNIGWLKDKKLSFPEKKYYTSSKGLKVEYWVMKPANFDPQKKYPLMLQIHGGPTAMWGPGEESMWHEYQYFCAQGYGVIYSNPRGSGGYGSNFLRANYQDWGTGPTEDVLAALDGAIAEGWADKSKLVVTGGSYAGYLTAWIVAHTNRFAAASSQRGVYDLTTFFGEGNAWRLVPSYFGGYPWEEKTKPVLQRESPFTYIDQIKTPYLIFHGETDLRTGIIQGEMMYKALKVLGRPVEYVQHPGGTHGLSRTGNVNQRVDQMLRIYEFFERYVQH